MELVREGHRPGAIIVYDGINESDWYHRTNWQNRTPTSNFVKYLQTSDSNLDVVRFAIVNLTRIDDAAKAMLQESPDQIPPRRSAGANWNKVIRSYLINLNLMKKIADVLEIPIFFYFQPLMQYEEHYGLRTFSTYEREILLPRTFTNEFMRRQALYHKEFAPLRQGLGSRAHDLYDVFRGQDGIELYADPRHPNGKGNRMIAERIYRDLARELQE